MLVLTAVSMAPDLDVLAWPLRAWRDSPWAHRGALHSLLAAAIIGALGALFLDRRGGHAVALLLAAGTAATHGLLDTITHGGNGVMLLWPFDLTRTLATWRPLPAAPIGARILSSHGLSLVAREALLCAPLLLAALWPRWGRPRDAPRYPT